MRRPASGRRVGKAVVAGVSLALACLLAVLFFSGIVRHVAWADDAATKYRQVEGTVYFSRSLDGKFAMSDGELAGEVMANLPIDLADVCQVDLDEYGLGEYNYPAPEGAGCQYECTALQLFVYVATHYAADSEMQVTGGLSHAYITRFWGEDENMLYYVNGRYPLERAGWGATCDTIVLSDGDVITNAHYTDWGFYSDPETGFHFFLEPGCTYEPRGEYASPLILGAEVAHTCTAIAGVPLEVRLARATGNVSTGDETSFSGEQYWPVYWGDEYDFDEYSLNAAGSTYTDADGRASIEFESPGTYWVWADGGFGTYGTDCEDSYVNSPAALRVEVLDPAEVPQAVWDARAAIMELPTSQEIAGIAYDDSSAVQAVQDVVAAALGAYEKLDCGLQPLVGADALAKLREAEQAIEALAEGAESFDLALQETEAALGAYGDAWALADEAAREAAAAARAAADKAAHPDDVAVSAADAAVDAALGALARAQEASDAADGAMEAASVLRGLTVSDAGREAADSLAERARAAKEQASGAVLAMTKVHEDAVAFASQVRAAAEKAAKGDEGGAGMDAGDEQSEVPKANPMKVAVKTVKAKASKLKSKALTVSAVRVKGAQGKVSYELVKVSAKKKLLKQARKKIKLASNGKLKLKKGLKKGSYKVTIRVRAAGNAGFAATRKTVTVKVVVK